MKKYLCFIVLIIIRFQLEAQVVPSQILRVLFLGNSYTYVNNLPQMLADMAHSAGDSLYYESNLLGGYTLQNHTADAVSMNKIRQGGWDYVVLQEQSQQPSFPISQVISSVFPYAKILNDTIRAYNMCAQTMFYMTWGRKNGDASNCVIWPPVCTYMGMDSLLRMRYLMMADSNQASVSPVGAVWREIIRQDSLIELYQSDESHPSATGTFAACCSFYSALFRKDPTLITNNFGLDTATTTLIKNTARDFVYDSLSNWRIGIYDPVASFSYAATQGLQLNFSNLSYNATEYHWSFGDGDTSDMVNPVHLYPTYGIYQVMLVATHCNHSDTSIITINLSPFGIENEWSNQTIFIGPNPAGSKLLISSEKFVEGTYWFEIFNPQGQKVLLESISKELRKEVDVSDLVDGLYFICVKDLNGSVWNSRFVKINEK